MTEQDQNISDSPTLRLRDSYNNCPIRTSAPNTSMLLTDGLPPLKWPRPGSCRPEIVRRGSNFRLAADGGQFKKPFVALIDNCV